MAETEKLREGAVAAETAKFREGACMQAQAHKFRVIVEEPILVYPETFKSEQTLRLSPLDMQAPLFMYTLYFYKKDNIKTSEIVFQTLKEALQKVLVLYYPGAGRLRNNLETGKPEIECNNQGALLVKATTDARIEELGDPMNTDPELEKFVYKLRPSSENPVLVAQVTTCACGGIIIGFGSRHEVFDAFSALQFLSAWGAVARGVPLSDIPIPSHNRELLEPKANSELSPLQQSSMLMKKFDGIPLLTRADEKKSWEGTVTDFASLGIRPQYIMKVFRLTKEMLDHLKHKAMESGEIKKCSTFDVVTAHAWQARVQSLEMDPSEKVMLRFPVDGRTKIDPPLPPCFIGNVFVMASHACTASDILDNPLSSIVKRVQQAKADVTNSYIRRMINALAATQIKALPSFRETTIVTDWTRFPHHLLDFGWGGTDFATQVAMPLLDVIFLTSSSSKDEDLFVRLGLLPIYMEKFEQHFLQIQPQTN